MKHKYSKIMLVLLTAVIISTVIPVNASAASNAVPLDSYTYWFNTRNQRPVASRPMYEAVRVLDSESLGTESFTELTDIYCDSAGKTYLLDGMGSRLLVLDNDYRIEKEIFSVVIDGSETYFEGAQGIYVHTNGDIYLADTENARVIVMDKNGDFLRALTLPESDLIPPEFKYRPMKVALDSRGYVYVLSEGSYYGAIMYSPKNEFLGFFGSNIVQTTPLQALEKLWNMIFMNNAKRAASFRRIPYQFVDLQVDKENFVFTITGKTNNIISYGQIKRLSPGGTNILYKKLARRSISSNEINFGEPDYTEFMGKKRIQDFLGIAINDDGFIFGMDSTYGKIYIYDVECNLLSVFGGGTQNGRQIGTFISARAIACKQDQILVCDAAKNSVTIFKITPYGKLVQKAQSLTLKADYSEAKPYWEQVLALDRNSQLAYRGLAKACFIEKDYKRAMEYARIGLDRDIYNQAFDFVRKEYIGNNFWWIFLLSVIATGALVAFMIYTTRHEVNIVRNEKLLTLLRTIPHPFQSFSDIKYKNSGSVPLAMLLVVLWYAACIFHHTSGGFLYTGFSTVTFNALYTLAQTIGLVLLWVIVNWAICTLFEGKGRMKEIFIVSAYSIVPMILYEVLFTLLSNVLTYDGEVLLTLLYNAAIITTAFLLCVGTMTVHDFSFNKFIGTSVATVLSMGLCIFILFMIGILLQQFSNFVITVFMEVFYR